MEIKLMTRPEMVRQGDVLCVPVNRVSDADIGETVEHGDKRVVLAFGEVTGHAHAFYPVEDKVPQNSVTLYRMTNHQKYLRLADGFPVEFDLLRVEERCLLRHEEHHWISFPPGDWAVIHQYEGDEYEELRRVAD